LGCCNTTALPKGQTCNGTLTRFQSSVACEAVDSCYVYLSQRYTVEYMMNEVDVSKFPFDEHNIWFTVYLDTPFTSTDVIWWRRVWIRRPGKGCLIRFDQSAVLHSVSVGQYWSVIISVQPPVDCANMFSIQRAFVPPDYNP
jgi:hypothetical protein